MNAGKYGFKKRDKSFQLKTGCH